MWAECEPKTAKLAEMRAEFCTFESNAPGLKANFYEALCGHALSSVRKRDFLSGSFRDEDLTGG